MDQPFLDLLDRLDQLPPRFPELREGARRAISIAEPAPEMALIQARKVLEFVVRQVFEGRLHEPAGTRPLENLLKALKDTHLPPRVYAYANIVRELGNV